MGWRSEDVVFCCVWLLIIMGNVVEGNDFDFFHYGDSWKGRLFSSVRMT